MNRNIRVIVGMSGGVDSSVSAYLLKKQGFQVEGLFMKNWEEDDTEEYCSATEDLADAQSVCDQLNIPLNSINFSAEYWDNVFEYFLQEYAAGRTPNPDIMCNKEIKFKAFLDYSLQLGADYIATGHYVQRTFLEEELEKANLEGFPTALNSPDNGIQMLRGLDSHKDQSYFLYTLGQSQLRRSLFPVGHLPKSEVRKIAEEQGFLNARKKDSTGICFIGERRFTEFLSQYLPAKPGTIKSYEGQIIGEHQGLMYHTLGQRKGLKIGGIKTAEEKPWYVIDKDLQNNVLIVAQGHEHPALFHDCLDVKQLHWVNENSVNLTSDFDCSAKIRYRQHDEPCKITFKQNMATVQFKEPQWAITPGQSIVFYKEDECLGGGIIENRKLSPTHSQK